VKIDYILRFLMVLSIVLLLWKIDRLEGSLELEQAAHKATIQERDQWKLAAETAELDAQAQAENTRRCLAREAQAAQSAQERQAIMRQVAPRPRTDSEKRQVVDDETRNRVAARLNRPL